MAALLVAMSIMAIMLTVAMPVWKQATQRDKEEELVFRGLQYTHAIGLFQRKYANAFPPNLDVLVTERFLRKKYKDPITNDDFVPILAGQGQGAPSAPAGQQSGRGASTSPTASPGRGQAPTSAVTAGTQTAARPGGVGGGPVGGIMGVTSKSKDKSIRVYNGRSHYNEWQFVYMPQTQAPGVGAPGAAAPGVGPGRGGPGTNSPFPGGFGGNGRGTGRGGPGTGRGAGTPPRGFGPGPGTMPPPPTRGRL